MGLSCIPLWPAALLHLHQKLILRSSWQQSHTSTPALQLDLHIWPSETWSPLLMDSAPSPLRDSPRMLTRMALLTPLPQLLLLPLWSTTPLWSHMPPLLSPMLMLVFPTSATIPLVFPWWLLLPLLRPRLRNLLLLWKRLRMLDKGLMKFLEVEFYL